MNRPVTELSEPAATGEKMDRTGVRFLILTLIISTILGACVPPLTPPPSPTETIAATLATPTTVLPDAVTEAPLPPTSQPTIAQLVEVFVYFTDSTRYASGTPPFERPVARLVPPADNLPEVVLQQFFIGPTGEERELGLEAITSGFTGFRELRIEEGVARVYLVGPCASNGATYTIAQPLMRNLLQFEEIYAVKIYDDQGTTELPDGAQNSIPFCLEP